MKASLEKNKYTYVFISASLALKLTLVFTLLSLNIAHFTFAFILNFTCNIFASYFPLSYACIYLMLFSCLLTKYLNLIKDKYICQKRCLIKNRRQAKIKKIKKMITITLK